MGTRISDGLNMIPSISYLIHVTYKYSFDRYINWLMYNVKWEVLQIYSEREQVYIQDGANRYCRDGLLKSSFDCHARRLGENLWLRNKMKNEKYHIIGTVPKFKIKIVERGKMDTPNMQISARSVSWLDLLSTDQQSPINESCCY